MHQPGTPKVSIVIPCRNEAGWIERCLESVARNDYPKEHLEVLVVDGMSEDGTRRAVEEFARRHPYVRLVDNPSKITPAALNVGISEAKGDVLMRLDAHYEYPTRYISSLVHWLQKSGADNVGGVLTMRAANESPVAQAIAVGVTHRFGVGNAYYRVGTSEPRWVDTVPFGCYRKEVFDRIGTFDEELVRNQDIELNLRLRKSGGSILLVPEVVIQGRARSSLSQLWRTYYQYGYFNPLVQRKLGGVQTFRSMIPPAFVLALLITGALAPWFSIARILLAAALLPYVALVVGCGAAVALKRGIRCGLLLAVVFPLLHISHGLGFLKGTLDFLILRRKVSGTKGGKIPLAR